MNNEDRDHFTGDKHRDSIMSRGSIHNGFPETGKFYSFKTNNKVLVGLLLEKPYNIIPQLMKNCK